MNFETTFFSALLAWRKKCCCSLDVRLLPVHVPGTEHSGNQADLACPG
jgi:hypothetical protein